MRLIKLELENIKSYEHEVINFNDGINCIIGLNGSGKSTIIESIGYALFNYNPTTVDSLLRYNETKGSISIEFEANDGIRYQIVRKVRKQTGGSVKIVRCEDGEVLQENVSNVYKFVNKILKISGDKTLAKLFEEIIAVPQGTFVNAFLETSARRKENFDKLFELDIYKKLADDVKKLSDKVEKEYIFNLEKDIAELNGQLINYDKKTSDLDILNGEVNTLDTKYKDTSIIYNKKQDEKRALDDLSTKYEGIEKEEISESSNNTILTHKKEEAEKDLNEAKSALDIVKANEVGYLTYKKNYEDLQKNQQVLNTVKDHKALLLSNNTKIEDNNKQIDILKGLNHDNKVDLGFNRQKIIDTTNDIDTLTKKTNEMKDEVGPLKDKNYKLAKESQIKYSDICNKAKQLSNIYESLLNYNKGLTPESYQEKIDKTDEELNEINEYKNQIIELGNKKERVNSDLENLKNNEQYMSNGLCPILKQECLNMKNKSLDCELTNLIKKDEELLTTITSEIIRLTSLTTNEQNLLNERQSFAIRKVECENDYKRYLMTIEELKKDFKEETVDLTEANDVEIVKGLYEKYNDLKDNYQDEELDQNRKKEAELNSSIKSNEIQIMMSNGTIKTIEDANKTLQEKIDSNNKKIDDLEEENVKLDNKNKDINIELVQFEHIEIDIQQNQNMVDKFSEHYEKYISNLNESKMVESREKACLEIVKNLNESNDKLTKLSEQKEELNKVFSKEELKKLIDEINELNVQIKGIETELNLKKNNRDTLKDELDKLDQIKEDKKIKENDVIRYQNLNNKFKMYRSIFINLPKELSQQIRQYIANYASLIYRRISNENVKIDILDDYEVVLIDCQDESKLKHLAQLSGGEQMSVAISIRLAMLKHITNIDIYFMDEPTVNLDVERRQMVAEVVKDIAHELTQLFVISHDDTFEEITDSAIKIAKLGNKSYLDR